jgi:predicted DNA-binding transcriptional regulator AlpA
LPDRYHLFAYQLVIKPLWEMIMEREAHSRASSVDDGVRLINAQQLRQLLPVSKMTIWRMEQRGQLPQHVLVNGRAFWRHTEVVEAIKQLTKAD